jgi:diadenylate cyclase
VPIDRETPLRATLALVAPGTALRDGLERILRGRTGALIVLGHDRGVEALCTGGFPLDVEFSSTRLRELCKMDGAVVLSSDGTRIVRAAVHLMPDPAIPTEESGTRHRTAERVAKQTGHPVISVSQSMHMIGLYLNGYRHVIDDSAAILSRANQALATLERYKARLDEVSGNLSALEIEDLVTARDAIAVVQRLEMVRRIADEIEGYVIELGTDGRLLALQLDELMAGVDSDRTLVIRDYVPSGRKVRQLDEAVGELDKLPASELIDLGAVAKAMGYAGAGDSLDVPVSPRGFRLLTKVPRLPGAVVERLVEHFGSLQRLLGATVEDLQTVEGVGDARARGVREGLSRLAEASILERYV